MNYKLKIRLYYKCVRCKKRVYAKYSVCSRCGYFHINKLKSFSKDIEYVTEHINKFYAQECIK